jgi:hypothetical protein
MMVFQINVGWALGHNITTGDHGIFPLAVCEEMNGRRQSRPRSEFSQRVQSLLPPLRF